MAEYLIRLMIVLPIVCGLAWGSLVLWKRVQGGLPMVGQGQRAVRIIDAVSMGPGGKIVVVEFATRRLLLSAARGGITLLAEAETGDA